MLDSNTGMKENLYDFVLHIEMVNDGKHYRLSQYPRS
jgi:hypothetical protein